MRESIECPKCRVTLKVPDEGIGRRLKCPKCGEKFIALTQAQAAGAVGSPSAGQTSANPNPSSSHSSPPRPSSQAHPRTSAGPNSSVFATYDSTEALPVSSGDGSLRELFDLAPPPGGNDGAGSGKAPLQADAAGLFSEEAEPPRRKSKAEERSKPRPCPSCGNFVPGGMSLCSMCGLDLDTGDQVDIGIDDMIDLPEQPRHEPPPLSVMMIGALGCLLSAALLVLSAVASPPGWIFLAMVCGFGIFGAVQFIRGVSLRFLIAALTLYAIFGFLILIAEPIYTAYVEPTITQVQGSDDPDAPSIQIHSAVESLNQDKLGWGIVVLLLYAAVSFFLLQNRAVRRYIHGHGHGE